MTNRKKWLVPALAVAAFLGARVLFTAAVVKKSADFLVFFRFAGMASQGAHAYRDFNFSYPPLLLPFVYVPMLFSGPRLYVYAKLLKFEMVAVEGACLLLALALARSFGFDRASRLGVALVATVLSAIGCVFLYDRFDFLVGLSLLASAWALQRGRKDWAYGATLVGALFKVVPLAWLFPLALALNRKAGLGARGRGPLFARSLLETLACVGLFAAALLLYDGLWSDGWLWIRMQGHLERGLQIESTWASPLLVWNSWIGDGSQLSVVTEFGAQHLHGPLVSELYVDIAHVLGGLLPLLALAGLAGLYMLAPVRSGEGAGESSEAEYFLSFTLALLALVLATQRVFSPQYLGWLVYPLALEVIRRRELLYSMLVTAIFALTYAVFAHGWDFLLTPDSIHPLLLAARNALVMVLCVVSFRDFLVRHHSFQGDIAAR